MIPNNKKIQELEKSGIVKQVSGLNIAKGESITDTDIIGAKQVIIYYTTVEQGYISSVIVSKNFTNQFVEVEINNLLGYFTVYFNSGVIQSSAYTNDIIKIVGYDIIK